MVGVALSDYFRSLSVRNRIKADAYLYRYRRRWIRTRYGADLPVVLARWKDHQWPGNIDDWSRRL